ncbi:NAD dependent epimerase/dehydratase like protein [Zymoseptoria brevis]|uniref:NAD dependent epimerase/dehydratase like protein n=1 Tax=Zymoseptoria brevis TaxID=1047168 RepID=A0A0F4GG21_9PEZI|nr:NAD dependent epimerase/dehydratase like protein [Zymoseptoria brevis]
MANSRLIDQVPDHPFPMEMQILILGMPRTGIISLRTALGKIGYRCFHGQMMDEFPELYPLWEEALRAKYYHEGEPFGPREYNKLLGNYNVSSNFPGTLVAEDLIKAYPNAKVILTMRDVDAWLESMKNSVDKAYQWRSFEWLAPWEPEVIGPWWKYHSFQHQLRRRIAPRGERQAFLDHYAGVKSLVPPGRLLHYNIGDGWEPLCRFLDLPKPDCPFPHVNNSEQFVAGRAKRWNRAFFAMTRKVVWPAALFISVCCLAYFIVVDMKAMEGL